MPGMPGCTLRKGRCSEDCSPDPVKKICEYSGLFINILTKTGLILPCQVDVPVVIELPPLFYTLLSVEQSVLVSSSQCSSSSVAVKVSKIKDSSVQLFKVGASEDIIRNTLL
jgi:hypothetical protein